MKASFLSFFISGALATGCLQMAAAEISIEMNSVSTTMSLNRLSDGSVIETGSPVARKYSFTAEPGEYLLTAYATDGKTVNGTLKLKFIESSEEQTFKVLTCTVYPSNKKEDKAAWLPDTDFTLSVEVMNRDGEIIDSTPGKSSTTGRLTFPALSGNSYFATISPTQSWREEGYMDLCKSGTLTANVNVTGAIPTGGEYSVTVPADAELSLGIKFTHFTKFRPVEPVRITPSDNVKVYTYRLANSQVYNYRTWKTGGLTHAGYFTMNLDDSKRPELAFTDEDYSAFSPEHINHSVEANDGYETGDILVNINPQGYLRLQPGESFIAHAMRCWELTDTAVGNYFIEPDFHYSVIDLDGNPSKDVLEIENGDTTTDPWTILKAVGEGTAIVLVTYDAIALDYYSGATKKPYMGGEIWGAVWPENTAAYVVSVGTPESKAIPNMIINEAYNSESSKISGKYIDAENDILYYLSDTEGARFTFSPESTSSVTLARPVIGERTVTYTGFSTEGVELSEDGSYTLTLPEGRNIVCLKDADGNATYQVITVKPCSVAISNETDSERDYFIAGDKVKMQFSGLRHPANKLAGIYNMSAYVTFNSVPNGTSLILGSNQYKFGFTPAAQAVTFTIPDDYDALSNPEWKMSAGTIQINGYGDPIGSHRLISPIIGRSPNFTAIAHKTYLGTLPDIVIPVSPNILSNIDKTDSQKEIATVFGVDGRRRASLQQGINIIVYTDGSTKKIMIK